MTDPNVITLFEVGTLVAEATPTYSGVTGERDTFELRLYQRGARGGKHTLWRGEPNELDAMIERLSDMRALLPLVPERITLKATDA